MMMSDVYDWFDRPLEQLKETISEHKEKLDEGHISEGDEVFEHSRFLADGVAAALDGYKNRAGWEEDYLEDGDEFEETDDRDTEESSKEDMPVPTFTFEKEVTLSGGYSLEKYIDDANKVVYRAGVEKGIKVCLKIDHTCLDRGPDDSVTTKWHEMVEKFGRDA